MIAICAAYAACVLAVLPPTRPDTPPPLPIPLAQLDSLQTTAEVIAAAVLANGARAPMNLVLPELVNRDQVLAFMVGNYPAELRNRPTGSKAWAWLFVNRAGKVGEFKIIRAHPQPALDSLSAKTLRIMKFSPARIGNDTVGVWAPYPLQIAAYQTLADALRQRFDDRRVEPGDPYFTPYTVEPRVLNRDEIYRALVQQYPPDLRAQKVGGTVQMWLFVNKQGRVLKALVKQSSGYASLDRAATKVAELMRFSPALNRDQPVNVWIALPILFKAQ